MISPVPVAARARGALVALAVAAAALSGAPATSLATPPAVEPTATADAARPMPAQIARQRELEGRFPYPAGAPAATHEVARGVQASVNFWRIDSEMPPHLHHGHEEVIVVQSGTVEATVGDRRVVLGPGDVLLVPRDTVHAGRALGGEPARGTSVFAPAFDGRDRIPAPSPAP